MITGSPDPDHPLGRMFSDLRESATGWPTTDKAADHIAAAVQESRLNVTAQASPAVMPEGRRVPRRRTVFTYLATSLVGKILVGSVAFAATGGTLAVTGSLPDPVQSAVASTVEVVGIHIPDPSDAEAIVVIDEAPEADEAVVADEASDAVEAKDAQDAVELADGDEAALEDAEAADESEHGALGLECAEKATELGDSGEAKEVDGSDSATQLGESEEAKELDCSDEATELKDEQAVELEDGEATEIEGTDEAAEMKESEEAPEVQEAPEAEEAPEVQEAPEAEEAPEVQEAPEAEEAPEAGDTAVTTTTAGSNL